MSHCVVDYQKQLIADSPDYENTRGIALKFTTSTLSTALTCIIWLQHQINNNNDDDLIACAFSLAGVPVTKEPSACSDQTASAQMVSH